MRRGGASARAAPKRTHRASRRSDRASRPAASPFFYGHGNAEMSWTGSIACWSEFA